MTCHECRQQLIAAEGEPATPSAAREHLAECAACQSFIRGGEQLRALVRNLAETEHAPAALRDQVEETLRTGTAGRKSRRRPWVAAAAAVILVALAGLSPKWYQSKRSPSLNRLAQEFIVDHEHYLPGREQIVSASARDVEHWFQGRVGFPVRVPQVPTAALEDARVCNIAGRKAALVHYRRKPDDTLISLFVAEAPSTFEEQKNSATVSAAHQGFNATLWSHRGLVYSVVAALDDASLRQITESVRQQEP